MERTKVPLYTDAEKRQKFYLSLWNVGGWVGLSLATWHGLGRALGKAMVVGEWSDTVVGGHGCGERVWCDDTTFNTFVLGITVDEIGHFPCK